MKISKKSETRNFRINTEYYKEAQLEFMMTSKKVFIFNSDFEPNYDWHYYGCLSAQDVRIFINGWNHKIEEVKVILDEFNQYTTVAVLNDGEKVFIKL